MKYVVAALAAFGLTLATFAYMTACPNPRYAVIGASPDGTKIVIFDGCTGLAHVQTIQPPSASLHKISVYAR